MNYRPWSADYLILYHGSCILHHVSCLLDHVSFICILYLTSHIAYLTSFLFPLTLPQNSYIKSNKLPPINYFAPGYELFQFTYRPGSRSLLPH